ncbi:MAG: TOBE domain-containing protein, partial [Bacilli bacterium]
KELKNIQKTLGVTTILVTHDQEEAMALSDEIILINEGAIVQMGTPKSIIDRPSTSFTANFIGDFTLLAKQNAIHLFPFEHHTFVAFRSDSVGFVDETTDVHSHYIFEGTVTDRTLLGSNVRYQIRIDDRNEIERISQYTGEFEAEPGDVVAVAIAKDAVHFLEN